QKYIDAGEPSSAIRHNLAPAEWDIVDSLVKELSKLCGKHGAMEGWKLLRLSGLELMNTYDSFSKKYGAKAILTRQITPLVPDIPEHVPSPKAECQEVD
ncbi:hypothetical protein MMC31_003468, partial [Peltigera leucophlebia]|nr:hypothetical protein [Peltigera leucophlebia]